VANVGETLGAKLVVKVAPPAAGLRARRRPEISRFCGKVAQASRLRPLKQTKEKKNLSPR